MTVVSALDSCFCLCARTIDEQSPERMVVWTRSEGNVLRVSACSQSTYGQQQHFTATYTEAELKAMLGLVKSESDGSEVQATSAAKQIALAMELPNEGEYCRLIDDGSGVTLKVRSSGLAEVQFKLRPTNEEVDIFALCLGVLGKRERDAVIIRNNRMCQQELRNFRAQRNQPMPSSSAWPQPASKPASQPKETMQQKNMRRNTAAPAPSISKKRPSDNFAEISSDED